MHIFSPLIQHTPSACAPQDIGGKYRCQNSLLFFTHKNIGRTDLIINKIGLTNMSKHRYQQIVDQIQGLIQTGEMQPGDRLPSERKLAQTFKVSRNSVREAIRALAEKGVLVSRLGDGTYLAPNDTTLLTETFAKAIGQQKKHIQEIFELRRIIEPQIAGLAAERHTPEQLQELKAVLLDQSRAASGNKDDSEFDREFHRILARSTGNSALFQVMETITRLLDDTRSRYLRDPVRTNHSVQGHISIIEAMEAHDGQAAEKAMARHIIQMQQAVLDGHEE
jgi:GntR family transcriptional repressor for pyruvate dehydrogenase complex